MILPLVRRLWLTRSRVVQRYNTRQVQTNKKCDADKIP